MLAISLTGGMAGACVLEDDDAEEVAAVVACCFSHAVVPISRAMFNTETPSILVLATLVSLAAKSSIANCLSVLAVIGCPSVNAVNAGDRLIASHGLAVGGKHLVTHFLQRAANQVIKIRLEL